MSHSQRKLFVHIGMPKAGSTSIQAMLAGWPAFFERAGIHVAVAGRQAGSHSQLYDDDGEPRRSVWNDLLHELIHCPARRFVMSWEPFAAGHSRDRRRSSGNRASDVAALGEAADVDVRIVAYVRPQYQYMESLYAESVKLGSWTAPFGVVVEDYLQKQRFDYHKALRPWRDTFADRIAIHPLDHAHMGNGALEHFLGVVGAVDPALAWVQRRRNPRIGAKHVEVLRLAGAALAALGADRPARARLLEPLRLGVPALLAADLPFAGLTPAEVDAVSQHFAASNARFARDYGIDPDGVLFRHPADGLLRPALADGADFSEVERARLRGLIDRALGKDIAEIVDASLAPRSLRCSAAKPRTGALQTLLRRRSAWDALHAWCRRLHSRTRLVCRQTRSIRDIASMKTFLRWLRWELEVRWRRLFPASAGGNESAARRMAASR